MSINANGNGNVTAGDTAAVPAALLTMPGWLQWLSERDLESMLASTGLTLPFVLLYCLEICVLLANWASLRSSFFALLILRANFDLLHFGFSFLNARLPLLGLFLAWFEALPGWSLCLFYWSKSYLMAASNLATVFMMFNRWTAIAFPVQHKQIWNRALPVCILLNFCIPLTYTGHMLGYTVYVRMQPDNKKFSLWDTGIDTGLKPNDTLIIGSTLLGFMLVTLIINFAVLRTFLRQNTFANMSQNQNEHKARVERKLTIYAVITFGAHFLHALYYFLLYLVFYQIQGWQMCEKKICQNIAVAVLNQKSIVDDLTHRVVPAILLVWACDAIRRPLLAKFRRDNVTGHMTVNNSNRWATQQGSRTNPTIR